MFRIETLGSVNVLFFGGEELSRSTFPACSVAVPQAGTRAQMLANHDAAYAIRSQMVGRAESFLRTGKPVLLEYPGKKPYTLKSRDLAGMIVDAWPAQSTTYGRIRRSIETRDLHPFVLGWAKTPKAVGLFGSAFERDGWQIHILTVTPTSEVCA